MKKIKAIIKKLIAEGYIPNVLIEIIKKQRSSFHEERDKKIKIVNDISQGNIISGNDYDQIVDFLVERGIPKFDVIDGSMPVRSLDFINKNSIEKLNKDGQILALHVGNFVGVSLAYLTQSLLQNNKKTLVISVDPNLTHRGIENPLNHVLALLSKCNLQNQSLVITGYSGKKSISNDGVVFGTYDPVSEYTKEAACENVINNLSKLSRDKFDIVFLDGNHEANYLSIEIQNIIPLLKPNAFIVLDDVDIAWSEIQEIYKNAPEYGLKAIATDGRVGILQYLI